MVRRVASQVHQQVSRLMRGNVIDTPPIWYQAVLDHPPLPLPAKAPAVRTAFDAQPQQPGRKLRALKTRPLPIYYLEDDVRRQFFRDHPFEAYRAKTLIERGAIEEPNLVQGKKWLRLRDRGRNPSSEDAIQYAITLYQHHGVSLSQAYARAVAQFRALRSEHHISTTIAVLEAEALGATFDKGEIAKGFDKEIQSLVRTWERDAEQDAGVLASRKRWRAILMNHDQPRTWSMGEEYVRLWREGVRPSYAPALTEDISAVQDSGSSLSAHEDIDIVDDIPEDMDLEDITPEEMKAYNLEAPPEIEEMEESDFEDDEDEKDDKKQ